MSARLFATTFLALGAVCVTPACSSGEAFVSSVQCMRDEADAAACQMSDTLTADGSHDITFVSGKTTTRFVGKSQSGWWSGTLDGKPAMGYERNRGHVVFSTTDLAHTFSWWSQGNEHGSY